MMRLLVVLALAVVAGVAQAPPTFRAGTDAVAVDAAVFDGDRVVANLRPADFELRDNGVR